MLLPVWIAQLRMAQPYEESLSTLEAAGFFLSKLEKDWIRKFKEKVVQEMHELQMHPDPPVALRYRVQGLYGG